MVWQDIVISIVGMSFGFMLIPMIKDSLKGKTINPLSAFLTMMGIYIIGITMYTLELYLSVISQLFSGTMWAILFILSIKKRKQNGLL